MSAIGPLFRRLRPTLLAVGVLAIASTPLPAQQWVTETRDPKQTQDEDFAKSYKEWTGEPALRQPARRPPPEGRGHPDRRRTCSGTTSARRAS